MVGRSRVVARRFAAGSAGASSRIGRPVRSTPIRRPAAFGWHAVARRHVGASGRAAPRRCRHPVAERRRRPAVRWVRGDVVRAEGVIRRTRRSRLPRCPCSPGDGRRAERRRRRTPGTVAEPVHPCGAGVPSLRRPVHRALVPGERGGAAPRAGARGRIAAGRRHDARLPGQRASATCWWCRARTSPMVLAPMLGLASLLHLTRWPRFVLASAPSRSSS